MRGERGQSVRNVGDADGGTRCDTTRHDTTVSLEEEEEGENERKERNEDV